MDARLESSAEAVTRMRDCLNDLVGIMALSAHWTRGDRDEIVSTLLDALLGTLRLAFVCVRLNDPEGGPSIEMMRGKAQTWPLQRRVSGCKVRSASSSLDRRGAIFRRRPSDSFWMSPRARQPSACSRRRLQSVDGQ